MSAAAAAKKSLWQIWYKPEVTIVIFCRPRRCVGEREVSENVLDMEPLKVVTIMSRNKPEFTTVAGAIQIAKVYRSGHSEFFGVMWESIKGKPYFSCSLHLRCFF